MPRFVLICFLLCSGLVQQGLAQSQSREIDALVEAFMQEERVVGTAVAVMKNGSVVHARGYGLADLERSVPATEHTVFKVASLSKQFTAVSILMLVEQEKIDLDAGIRTYFPEFPASLPNPTVRQLMSHTSGIDFEKAWSEIAPGATVAPNVLRKPESLQTLFAGTTFMYEPGTRFRYNNNAFSMLGLLIERVSGVSYATFLDRHIFQPLGLEHTFYMDASAIISNRASGYTFRGDRLVNAPFSNINSSFSAGALGSTVRDLLTWRRALLESRLLKPESSRAMTTPGHLLDGTPIPYGLGLFLLELDGKLKVDHYGNTTGFRAELAYYPDPDLTVTVLSNTNPSRTEVLESRIARLVMGIPETTVTEVGMGQGELRIYAGTYLVTDAPISHRSVATEVILRDDGLYAGRSRLRPIGHDVFVPNGDPYHRYSFTVRDGKAVALRVEREKRLIADARRTK